MKNTPSIIALLVIVSVCQVSAQSKNKKPQDLLGLTITYKQSDAYKNNGCPNFYEYNAVNCKKYKKNHPKLAADEATCIDVCGSIYTPMAKDTNFTDYNAVFGKNFKVMGVIAEAPDDVYLKLVDGATTVFYEYYQSVDFPFFINNTPILNSLSVNDEVVFSDKLKSGLVNTDGTRPLKDAKGNTVVIKTGQKWVVDDSSANMVTIHKADDPTIVGSVAKTVFTDTDNTPENGIYINLYDKTIKEFGPDMMEAVLQNKLTIGMSKKMCFYILDKTLPTVANLTSVVTTNNAAMGTLPANTTVVTTTPNAVTTVVTTPPILAAVLGIVSTTTAVNPIPPTPAIIPDPASYDSAKNSKWTCYHNGTKTILYFIDDILVAYK